METPRDARRRFILRWRRKKKVYATDFVKDTKTEQCERSAVASVIAKAAKLMAKKKSRQTIAWEEGAETVAW